MLVACDVYRPAAIEQLKVLAEQIGVPVYTEEGKYEFPSALHNQLLKKKKRSGNDVVIIDTAGRSGY